MNNLNLEIRGNSFIGLLFKCEQEGGVLVFKPTGSKIIQYLSEDLFNTLNIEKTSTTLVYHTKDKGDLLFHEYIYISLMFAIQDLSIKINVNNITNELVDYVRELTDFIEEIEDIYNLDIPSICNRM